MTTIRKNFKIKLVAIMIAFFMLLSSTSAALISISSIAKKVLFAYESTLDIGNGDFENPTLTTGSTLPGVPTSWTELNKIDGVTAGVISLETDIATEDNIQKKYKLQNWIPSYLEMHDKQVLMINSENFATHSGYRSSPVDLQKSSYYVIQFWAYTEAASNASAKLTGSDKIEKAENTISINTGAAWRQYRFFVQTSSLETISASLEFWLGNENGNTSKGAAFFDGVQIKNYDQNTFMTALNNDINAGANYKYINLDRNYVAATEFIANPSFESPLAADNWTMSEDTNLVGSTKTISGIYSVANFDNTDTKVQDTIENTNVYGNTNALLINNLESGFVGYKSSYFTAKKNTLYKLSFLAKTGSISGNATVKLLERNPYTNEELSNGTPNPNYYAGSSYEEQTYSFDSINTSDYANEPTNNWKEYSCVIKTSPLIDIELCLEVSVDGKGYALFDNFTLMKITSNEYTSNKEGNSEFDLNQYKTEMEIVNGNFNLVTINDISDTYPLEPQNWTLSASNSTAEALNGIVNTAENVAGMPIIPALNNGHPNNNVLMIGNVVTNSQKYKSSGKTIEAEKYAKITFDVLTNSLNAVKASFRIVCDDIVLGEIANIDTNNTWKNYSILLKTGFEEKTISIELCLGNDNLKGTGFAFFDNVNYEEIEADDFNNDTETKKIDLLKSDFTNISDENVDGIYTSYDYTAKSTDGAVTAGVIDTSKYGLPEGYNSSSLENPGHPEDENSKVLMIKSSVDTYYAYASNMTYKLESGKFYQITVKVKTQNMAQDEENKQYKDSDNKNAYPYGASIVANGIDASFVGIVTDGEWKTYTIYINNTADNEITLELGIGSENAKTKGTVYYSCAEINVIDQNQYLDGIEVLEDGDVDNVLAIGSTDKPEEKDENENNNSSVQFDWLVVPSLIFGIVILFAVGAVLYRNVKKKSHKKVAPKEYSRDNMKKLSNSKKTKNKDLSQRKAKLLERQNAVAVMINEQRRIGTDESKANVEKLEKEYKDINKKLADLEKEKKNANKEFKQKKTELKAKKKANKQK